MPRCTCATALPTTPLLPVNGKIGILYIIHKTLFRAVSQGRGSAVRGTVFMGGVVVVSHPSSPSISFLSSLLPLSLCTLAGTENLFMHGVA